MIYSIRSFQSGKSLIPYFTPLLQIFKFIEKRCLIRSTGICIPMVDCLSTDTSANTAISPSQQISVMKMTPAASAAHMVAMETPRMKRQLLLTFVIRRLNGDLALLRGRVKGIIMHM